MLLFIFFLFCPICNAEEEIIKKSISGKNVIVTSWGMKCTAQKEQEKFAVLGVQAHGCGVSVPLNFSVYCRDSFSVNKR